jgi:hypothetical protein
MDNAPEAARTARRTAELILDNAMCASVEADANDGMPSPLVGEVSETG